MKLGLMQPYLFPYLGYFDLIYRTDLWIVFDTVQYIRKGWINRNRVLHPKQGWQYITVPVKKRPRNTPIREINIAEFPPWRNKIVGQLQHYKKRAPFFPNVMNLLEECLHSNTPSLTRLNVRCLNVVCDYLGIEFHYRYLSEMQLDVGPITAADDWALLISEALGAAEYMNLPGGMEIYNPEKFHGKGIKLTIRHLPFMEYSCPGYEFIPNLSIIDVLMWNEPAKVVEFLERHE